MSAAVGHSVYGFRMVRDVEGIQLTEDRYLRAWFSCLNIGVKARNVSGFDECVSKCLVFLYEIVVSLPLGVAGLRMSPDPALRVEDELFCGIYVVYDQLLLSVMEIPPEVCNIGRNQTLYGSIRSSPVHL